MKKGILSLATVGLGILMIGCSNVKTNNTSATKNSVQTENKADIQESSSTINTESSDDEPVALKTATFEIEQNGVKIQMVYSYMGDLVLKQTTTSIGNYAAMGIDSKEQAQEALASVVEQFSNVKGVTHTIDYQEDQLIESTEVDYSKADLQEVAKLTGSIVDEGSENAKFVSMSQSEKLLLDSGYTKVD